MPSPSASRSSVMRFALGTADPAFFISVFMNQPLMPLPSSGSRRSGGLGDQHVAVRQHMEPAGMLELAGETRHGKPGRTHRCRVRGPPLRFGNIYCRYQFPLRRRQLRLGADARLIRNRRNTRARGCDKGQPRDDSPPSLHRDLHGSPRSLLLTSQGVEGFRKKSLSRVRTGRRARRATSNRLRFRGRRVELLRVRVPAAHPVDHGGQSIRPEPVSCGH